MDIAVWITFVIGIAAGGSIIYIRQRKLRMEELEKAAAMTEDILAGRKLRTTAPGDELLLARIENQLVRIQEMLDGRRKEAEKSRDEIQKLISEIAHQMRTPLTNIESYTGFLKDMAEITEPKTREGEQESNAEISLQYVSALEESERKLHFLVDSFVKMARLEQHIIQIRKNERNLLKTIQNTFGQIQNRAEKKQIRFHITMPEQAVCIHDSNWLGEAVFNVLDNAVKYSESGGTVEVSLRQNEMYLKLQVRDYGILRDRHRCGGRKPDLPQILQRQTCDRAGRVRNRALPCKRDHKSPRRFYALKENESRASDRNESSCMRLLCEGCQEFVRFTV